MTRKAFSFLIISAFLFSLIFSSCSHQTRSLGNSTVTFSIDKQTVNEILQNKKSTLSTQKSSRSADDGEETTATEPAAADDPTQAEDPAEEEDPEEDIPEDNTEVENASYDSVFIEVSILGDFELQKTALVKENEPIQLVFRKVPLEAVIYAQAQVYSYTDESKTTKNIFYRGQSSSIIVRSFGNKLSVSLEQAKLTVTFESNGGTPVEPLQVISGEKIIMPENPTYFNSKTKSVNAFLGWYTDPEFKTLFDFNTPVTQDLVLYAKWVSDFVLVPAGKVTDYLTSGRITIQIPELYVSQHEVTQAEYFEVTGLNPSLRKKKGDNYPVENVSWYDAIVYCNLLSIKEGFTPCYTIKDSVKPEEWGSVPTTNDEEWNKVQFNTSANGYRLLTEAEWEYVARQGIESSTKAYDDLVLYYSNSKGNTQTVTNRQTDDLGICNILGNVSEWCFDWYSASVPYSTPAEGLANGTNRVKRGGDYNSSKAECSVTARSSNSPYSKNGTTGFRVARAVTDLEWTSSGDEPGDNPGGNENGNEGGNENGSEAKECTITFDSNGGSEVEVQIVISGNKVTAPAEPVKTGYIFKGWMAEDENFDFESLVSGDITLKASWEAITYTIVFKPGISTDTTQMPSLTLRYDEEKTLSECTYEAPSGMKFAGWITDAEKVDKQDSVVEYENKKLIKNLTDEDGTEIILYALWIDKDRCTITYVLDDYDVTTLEPGSFLPSQAVTLPVVDETEGILVRTGYTFAGWFEDPGYNSATVITGWTSGGKESDIKVYGKWEIETYQIEYSFTDGGSWVSGYTGVPASYTVEDPVSLPPAEKLRKDFYDFTGWYDSNNQKITSWSAGEKTGKIEVTAKWTPETYTITYDSDVVSVDPATYTVESAPITLPTLSQSGWTFGGWYKESDFSDTAVTTITPGTGTNQYHSSFTLYAKWSSGSVNVDVTNPTDKVTLSSSYSSGVTTFTATNTTGATTYKWYVDGVEDTSATGNTFTFDRAVHTKGVYTITVECGGYSATTSLVAAIGTKLEPDAVLDIVFTDGSAIAYQSGLSLSDEQKAAAVAVIFYTGTECSNDSRQRILGLGLKNSNSDSTPTYAWAKNDSTGYSTKFTNIAISKSTQKPTDGTVYYQYISNYFTGDFEGSDNWSYICLQDPTGTADAEVVAENYSAFNYVNNYAVKAGLTGIYATGWYMPSLVESHHIYKKTTQLNTILELLNNADILPYEYYWSSSQIATSNSSSWPVGFDSRDLHHDNKSNKLRVCVFREP